MEINQIKEDMNEINFKLKRKVNIDCDRVRGLISEISENATNINSGQGLTAFLDTRDRFHVEVERLRSEYHYLLCKSEEPK